MGIFTWLFGKKKSKPIKEEKYDFDKHNVRGQLSNEPNKYDIAFDNMQKTGREELRKRAEALANAKPEDFHPTKSEFAVKSDKESPTDE